MNTTLLCLLALAAADPVGDTQQTIYRPTIYRSQGGFQQAVVEDDLSPLIVRAQGSPFFGGGGTPPTYAPPGGTTYPPTTFPPTTPGTADPFAGGLTQPYGAGAGAPYTSDPFLGGGQAAVPYGYNPYGQGQAGGYTFGLNGAQPFRYGWQARYDFTLMPKEGTSSPDVGGLRIFAADFEKELTTPLNSGYTFSIAPQFNYRQWDGPRGIAGGNAGLPPNAYRFGLGLKLASPTISGWQLELGFNPAIATDFNSGLSSDAFLFDGHAVAFYRTSPQWMWALGVAYWDRVDDIILPYAGAIWTPNDYLELRLLFPRPRISLFLGTPYGIPTWLYAAGEYHVEAYQVDADPIGRRTRVQFEDIRVTGGARWEFGSTTAFLEAGWVFDRKVDFDAAFGTDFDIDSGFIGRAGIRY